MQKIIPLALGPLAFVLLYGLVDAQSLGMSKPSLAVLATAVWMATWWISEAVPLAATALLPLLIFPLTGVSDLKTTGAVYAGPIIFLFIGGFMLATAIERWKLHKRIALQTILWVGTGPRALVLGFMLATSLLSMWISNTATSIMMLPIALAIVSELGAARDSQLGKALMLGIAYSASIGGIATLIGTPTNIIFAGAVQEYFEQEIAFSNWMLFALPTAAVLLLICWWYLVRIAYRLPAKAASSGNVSEIEEQKAALGKMRYEEYIILAVFALVALGWLLRPFLLQPLLPDLSDTAIVLIGVMLLFMWPARDKGAERVLEWQTAVQIPWGIILLFGGGLSLAGGFKASGLAEWMGGQLQSLESVPLLLMLLLLIAGVNFLTEVTSNIATVSMILPVLVALSSAIGAPPLMLMIGATCAASCAFMLPVATAPNAIAFGSGYLKMGDMVRAGFWMNLISIFIFTLVAYFFSGLVGTV